MANNYKHTRTISDTIKVKGVVTCQSDGTFITYEKDKEEYTVDVLDLFNQFSLSFLFLLLKKKSLFIN